MVSHRSLFALSDSGLKEWHTDINLVSLACFVFPTSLFIMWESGPFLWMTDDGLQADLMYDRLLSVKVGVHVPYYSAIEYSQGSLWIRITEE